MKFRLNPSHAFAFVLALLVLATPDRVEAERAPVIVTGSNASQLEKLAALEVQRYVYLRSDRVLDLRSANSVPKDQPAIVITRADRRLAEVFGQIKPQSFRLKTFTGKTPVLYCVGADDISVLYAAYRLAEVLGIRFYLDGDVVPDEQERFEIPVIDEKHEPLFRLRGIQPFHDFPEGPDWWNKEDYRGILGQLPKLRMNFIGLHTYPEGHPGAEPTVWIGTRSDIGEKGSVNFSYPSSYANSLRKGWGYEAGRPTGQYSCGASLLFEDDAYGSTPMLGHCPEPKSPSECNEVFNNAAALLKDTFHFAHQFGIKTCVGTETPLIVPKLVEERLKAAGKDPKDPGTLQELYEGIYQRILKSYDLDYYWFWTPEKWTWEGTKPEQVMATTNDLAAAYAAWKKVSPPFALATCGWVLGPQDDRALFDKILPRQISISCINRQVGYTPIDAAFGEVKGRSKWAIPWLEDDGALTAPQLWAGRMRRDAADALKYGCDGLLGIHWRTRILSPNVGALAAAAWDQSWDVAPDVAQPKEQRAAGADGGRFASFTAPIADTEDDPLYQTVRWDVLGYHLPANNGVCTVTLRFCEPTYDQAGKRVFDIKLQENTVFEKLDIYSFVKKNCALDFIFTNVIVTNGWLDIGFVPRIEYPAIAAIEVASPGSTNKINCGGPAYKDFKADFPAQQFKVISRPAGDFYADWAGHQFGREIGGRAALLFTKLDGAVPHPLEWVRGPGGMKPDTRSWDEVRNEYGFVDEFARLAPEVKGAGNRDRFTYWLQTFEYFRAAAKVRCTWREYNATIDEVKKAAPDQQKEKARVTALPLRHKLVADVIEAYRPLMALVSNPGEMGTVMNWESHIFPDLLDKPGEELAQIMGEPLPASASLPGNYVGPTRIVPTFRGVLENGEDLALKVIVLSEQSPQSANLYWRKLGKGSFKKMPLTHVNRGVYSVRVPASQITENSLEYYIEVLTDKQPTRFPAMAPVINQTVVVLPKS